MRSWNVPELWKDGECWIIGGGPSIAEQFNVPAEVVEDIRIGKLPPSTFSSYMEAIHNKHVIGINSAFLLGDWVDICFFGDSNWLLDNIFKLHSFNKIIVGCHEITEREDFRYLGMKYMPRNPQKESGICGREKLGSVAWNKNSGTAAISIAAQLGAKRIILLGFDMNRTEDKRQHWHGEYKTALKPKADDEKNLPFATHLQFFPDVANDAKRLGLEIINASPNSAIEEFPKMTVKELL